MNINIILIRNRSINLESIKYFLNKLENVKIIGLKKFINDDFKIKINDLVLYQTYPDNNFDIEKENLKFNKKFDQKIIEKADLKFLYLPNKFKILIDLHDEPESDGFERFINDNYPFLDNELKKFVKNLGNDYFYNFPRIKHCPGYNFKKKYNIIFDLHCYIEKKNLNFQHIVIKKKIIHYYCNEENNKVRQLIRKKLEKNKNLKFINFHHLQDYRESINKIYVEVNAPGWGRACYRNLETLNSACLLFIYDNFKDFDIIPNTKLIENEDYISFNLDNLDEKIDFILNNTKIVNKIRMNGYNKFIKNYDMDKRALEFKEFILKYL